MADDLGNLFDDLVINEDDLDEQTKRELLLNPNFQQFTGVAPEPTDPKCRWCKGTGEITINFKTEPCADCQPG